MKKYILFFICLITIQFICNDVNAINFKIKGQWQVLFMHGNVQPLYLKGADSFGAVQRFRTQIDAVANENLSGSLGIEIGRIDWGKSSTHGSLGTDGNAVEIRHAYLDWKIPNTKIKFRMGLQPIKTPGSITKVSPIFNQDMAAVTVSTPIYRNNDFSLNSTFFWARPYNDNASTVITYDNAQYLDNLDVFALMLPIRSNDFEITPWFMYSLIGKYSLSGLKTGNEPAIVAPRGGLMPILANGSAYTNFQTGALSRLDRDWGDGFWAGLTGKYTYKDWTLAFDFNYGYVNMGNISNYKFNNSDNGQEFNVKRSGWYAGIKAEYAYDWGIPGLILWYASGDDSNPYNGSERLPQFNSPWQVTTLGFGGVLIGQAPWKALGSNPAGMASVILQARDISFIENLKHTLRAAYFWGTNSCEMPRKTNMQAFRTTADGPTSYLTTKDTAFELDFITQYKMYENFTISLEASYLRINLDNDTWKHALNNQLKDNYLVNLMFTYDF